MREPCQSGASHASQARAMPVRREPCQSGASRASQARAIGSRRVGLVAREDDQLPFISVQP
jgi:hypothetical protein